MIEIVRDKAIWNKYIDKCEDADVYHTFDYHQVTCGKDESPILVVYSEGNQFVLLPLLLRSIKGSEFKDVTSVYGYCGPLAHNLKTDFNARIFQQELKELLLRHKIVSVFSRLHPFVSYQSDLLSSMGEILSPGDIVNIDLTKSEEQQQQYYNRRLKTYINKCQRNYKIHSSNSAQDLKSFMDMYYVTMKRVGADSRYFFSEEYFKDLIESSDFETDLLLAWDISTSEIAGGAIFFKKNATINYHLSGVKDKFLKLNPIKLLLDEQRIIGMKEGYKNFNLGGGVGNQEDSLFRFKSGYSDDYKPFKLWRYIVNKDVYRELVKKKYPKTLPETNFFPLYRSDVTEFDSNS